MPSVFTSHLMQHSGVMSMLNVMIDTETLALGENAVILQVGLVTFDDKFMPLDFLDLKIDVTASLLDGFEASKETCRDFWAKQDKNVIRSVMYEGPRMPPRDAARVLDQWFKDNFRDQKVRVYANGILFDIPKIDNLMTRYGMKSLTSHIKYNQIIDFRSIRTFVKEQCPDKVNVAEGLSVNNSLHNAVADSQWQISMLGALADIVRGNFIVDFEDEPEPEPKPRKRKRGKPESFTHDSPQPEEKKQSSRVVAGLDNHPSETEDEHPQFDEDPDGFLTHVFGGGQ